MSQKQKVIDAEVVSETKDPESRFVGTEVCDAAADVAQVAAKIVGIIDEEQGQKIADAAARVRAIGDVSERAAERATVVAGQVTVAAMEGRAALGRLGDAWKKMASAMPKREPLRPVRR